MKFILLSKNVLVLFSIALFVSCQGVPEKVERVLQLAGDNREELEKVIDHYQAPEDSLKLKAAYFLIIEKIPYESYIDSNEDQRQKKVYQLLNDSLKPFLGKENEDNFDERNRIVNRLIERYELENGKIKENSAVLKRDLHTISASFLIENIEYAFKAWNLPWSKKYNFQQFCQYILPYRSGNQYPNAWRKYFFNELKPFRDSVGKESDAVVVCSKLNELMNQKKFMGLNAFSDVPNILSGPRMYKYNIFGNCVSLSNLVIETMRSIGIPTTEILLNRYGDIGKNHMINAVLGRKGEWYYFNALKEKPGEFIFKEKLTKAYRRGLIDVDSLTKNRVEAISKIKLFGWEDITKEVMKTYNVTLKLSPVDLKKEEIVYLCVFDSMQNETWVPIDWALISNSKKEVVFKDIGGKEVVYLAMIHDELNGLRPVSVPFVLKNDGSLRYIISQKEKISAELKRKYPRNEKLEGIAKSLVGVKFEGSNSPNFENSKILYRLDKVPDVSNSIVDVQTRAFRYYRFVYPKIEEGLCYDMAKLAFGNKIGNSFVEAKGSHFASKGINNKIIEGLFDSDLFTYSSIYKQNGILKSSINKEVFTGFSEDVWVGLDLGIPKRISQINYCPRSDLNEIYANMQYELFYWDNKWVSLGQKKANKNSLIFEDAPKGSLFWLKNHTEGNEERIFTYENGKQVWW